LLGWLHRQRGDFEEAIPLLQAALELYERLSHEPLAARELSLPFFAMGAPLTQPLSTRASEALSWLLLAFAQVNAGQVQQSIASSRRALALSQESKNVWTQVFSTGCLSIGLLEAGAYEEAFRLMQHAVTLARTLPLTVQGFVFPARSVYHALQQWDEALAALQEAEAIAERLDHRRFRQTILTRLCMHYALTGEWEAASHYAKKAIVLRKSTEAALITADFYWHYETDALLHAGEERQAQEEVQRLGECLGSNRRFHIPYLRSLALVADWQGLGSQAIAHLREAAEVAADLGLPEEQWQIQARLARLYEAEGETAQAHLAWAKASTIIQGLVEGIKDETRRARFLAGQQIQPVLQHAQSEPSPDPQDHAEQSGR